jgi:excisionase family DNA binding protein
MPGTEKEIAVGIAEAARRIGVSARTLATLIAQDGLPSRKVGRRRIIPVSALERSSRKENEHGPQKENPQAQDYGQEECAF